MSILDPGGVIPLLFVFLAGIWFIRSKQSTRLPIFSRSVRFKNSLLAKEKPQESDCSADQSLRYNAEIWGIDVANVVKTLANMPFVENDQCWRSEAGPNSQNTACPIAVKHRADVEAQNRILRQITEDETLRKLWIKKEETITGSAGNRINERKRYGNYQIDRKREPIEEFPRERSFEQGKRTGLIRFCFYLYN